MIRFNSDYQEGALPRILDRLIETNMVQTNGYGEDAYCEEAKGLIRAACRAESAAVHFLVGGTQTNFTFLSAALRPHQGVIAAASGHIAVHETGAVEATGHKVIELPHANGKINAEQVRAYCRLHFGDDSHEHMVMPKVVYISQPTEYGTLYSRAEIEALRAVCDEWKLYLYLDGARLGYGMASEENDVDLPFLAETTDAFYIGGTKQGALFGEALVIRNDALQEDFRYIIKQKGGMLAKGRLLGLQFIELFSNDLYMEASRHAHRLAMKLKAALKGMGVEFLIESPTNQQFPILPDAALEALNETYAYSYSQRVDERRSCVRFCTSWATREEDVDRLIADLHKLLQDGK